MIKPNFFEEITEGNTNIFVYKTKNASKGPSSKNDVPFYNPSMQLNRDISILVCQQLLNNSKRKMILLFLSLTIVIMASSYSSFPLNPTFGIKPCLNIEMSSSSTLLNQPNTSPLV